ncbi:MAG: rhomboid family intramembrane serine protease [Candidatus Heimdallarchaeota archaeon]|nr:MAG: rhomboid family intramembrane serine protease [Candidatus Heimdallarchaeota archaeon]
MKEFFREFETSNTLPSFFVTWSLSIGITGIYLLFMVLYPYRLLEQSPEVIALIGQDNEMIFRGEIYRLFTAIWIHGNVVHLSSNLLFLLIFSSRLEELTRGFVVVCVFILSGIIGNLATLLLIFLDINFYSIGASGAIYGLLGALYYHLRGKSKHEQRKALYMLILFFMITIGSDINVFAHLFGLLGGIGSMWIMSLKSAHH